MSLYEQLSVHLDAIGELASGYDDHFPMPADVSDAEARLSYLVGILHAADQMIGYLGKSIGIERPPQKPFIATLQEAEVYGAELAAYRAKVESLKQAKREAEAMRLRIADEIKPLLPERVWIKVGDWHIGSNGGVQLCTNGNPWPL